MSDAKKPEGRIPVLEFKRAKCSACGAETRELEQPGEGRRYLCDTCATKAGNDYLNRMALGTAPERSSERAVRYALAVLGMGLGGLIAASGWQLFWGSLGELVALIDMAEAAEDDPA